MILIVQWTTFYRELSEWVDQSYIIVAKSCDPVNYPY